MRPCLYRFQRLSLMNSSPDYFLFLISSSINKKMMEYIPKSWSGSFWIHWKMQFVAKEGVKRSYFYTSLSLYHYSRSKVVHCTTFARLKSYAVHNLSELCSVQQCALCSARLIWIVQFPLCSSKPFRQGLSRTLNTSFEYLFRSNCITYKSNRTPALIFFLNFLSYVRSYKNETVFTIERKKEGICIIFLYLWVCKIHN